MCKSKPFEEWPEIMTAEDLKGYLGFGHVEAYYMFNRPDLPLINKVRRGKKIGKYALREYLNKGTKIQ